MALLSLIIPCYNEEKNIPLLVERMVRIVDAHPGLLEVVMVENGSRDDSRRILEEAVRKYTFLKLVLVEKNIGYGHGIMAGLARASAPVLSWTHADLQTDPEDVVAAYMLLVRSSESKGKIAVKGRRGSRRLLDAIFTVGMSLAARLLLGERMTDINAQPKLFGRDLYALLVDPPLDFSLDLYWMYCATRAGYQIAEVRVGWLPREHGISKSAPNLRGKIKTAARTISAMVRLRNARVG